jgi:L-alanine-DL-glutamate epimerase-like enolase superfamily enzyme
MKEAAGPDYLVGIDPNMKFRHPHVAAQLASELEPFATVANFENPIWKYHLDWYRLLREKTSIPLAMHLHEPADVLAALKAECCDQFNLSGRPQRVLQTAALAEAADIPCWTQMGGLCLGILAAYSVHVQATIPNAILPCDELPFIREADFLGGSLVLRNGHFQVPEGPGLGVELDMDMVNRHRVA